MTGSFVVRLRGAAQQNADGSDRQLLLQKCRSGQPLQLIAQPDNPHDRHAVAVFNATGGQLGYLPSDARDASSILRGEPISARVEKRIGGPSWWHRLFGIKRHYGLLIRLEKGEIDWQAHNRNRDIAAEIDALVSKAIAAEREGPESDRLVHTYSEALRKVVELNSANPTAAAHRYQRAPVNRLTMLLVKLKRQEDALAAYNLWRSVPDPVGLSKSELSALEKRVAKLNRPIQ